MNSGTFAGYLAGLDEGALAELLRVRPDVRVQPVPRGFEQLAQRLGGADSLVAALRTHNRDAVVVGLLSDAVDHQHDVVITYRDRNGSRTVRAIRPNQVYGRWLDSWCHLRNGQRDFTVANIESVSPVG